jgi:Putative beta barrel porin-7 (BBP7)
MPAANTPANPPPSKFSPWRPIQAAYRQLTESKSDTASAASGPPPAADVVDPNISTQPPLTMAPTSSVAISPRIAYIRADVVQPPPDVPSSDPKIYSTGSMPITEGTPPDVNYASSSGCGCGGGGSPDGSETCHTCGGWQPGTCSTHDPNGSCVLQRFACCLCKPYPDCSNGCVDFCHSWIFHEDDCWLFSNHKCCTAGCGPYPYGTCATDGQGKGSGGCGCACGPCVPPPDVYFTVGAVALKMQNSARTQTLANETGAPVLSTGDFDFDWRVGPSFVLGYRPTKMDAWELSYFGLMHWNDGHALSGAGDLSLPGDIGGIAPFTAANTLDADYTSTINNAEINYFWHEGCESLMWMAGFRYFNLNEKFDYTTTGTDTGIYDVGSDNNLYGGQLGVRLRECCTHFECDLTAKAGAFGNSTQVHQFLSGSSSGAIAVTDSTVDKSNWAFVGDLGANASYYICRNWCVMAGCNVIWVDGVALAPDQLDFTNTATSRTSIDQGGNLFMYGSHVGLGCRW